jgi:hypothetical protein
LELQQTDSAAVAYQQDFVFCHLQKSPCTIKSSKKQTNLQLKLDELKLCGSKKIQSSFHLHNIKQPNKLSLKHFLQIFAQLTLRNLLVLEIN